MKGGIVAAMLMLCIGVHGGSKKTQPQPLAPEDVPPWGNFYSMQRTNQPPLPFCPIPGADLYVLEANTYVYDDLAVDYLWLEKAALTLDFLDQAALGLLSAESGVPTPPGAGGGGSGGDPGSGDPPTAYDYPPGSLWIEITGVNNDQAYLTVHGTEAGVTYQLQTKPDLNVSGWTDEWYFTGVAPDTVLDPFPLQGRPMLFFRVAAACAVYRPGFTSFALQANDDDSVGPVSLPFVLNYFGISYTDFYVNNNGNVTFYRSLATWTPDSLANIGREIVAPFWADVDTRDTGSEIVRYGTATVGGRSAFGVNWMNVGYFTYNGGASDKLVSAQLVLIDRSDIASGDFDMEFNYCHIGWEAGEDSGGQGGIYVGPEGVGSPARAGFASSTGSSFEFAGSGTAGALLDSNPTTGLIHNSYNSPSLGRYVFQFRNGVPLGTP